MAVREDILIIQILPLPLTGPTDRADPPDRRMKDLTASAIALR